MVTSRSTSKIACPRITVLSGNKQKRKIECKTLEIKYKAIQAVAAGKKKGKVAAEFGVRANTLSTWLKNQKKITANYESSAFGPENKRMRAATYANLEKALDEWLREAHSKNLSLSWPIIQSKAKDFAKKLGYSHFSASNGWLYRFKKRHGIRLAY